MQLICCRHSSHHLLPPVAGERGRRWDATPQVPDSKAELKQRFLIRLEKVETKMISLVHLVRIRIKDEPPQWMTASTQNQGYHFLEMTLKIAVDHYFFLVLHLRPRSIPMAHFFCKEPF